MNLAMHALILVGLSLATYVMIDAGRRLWLGFKSVMAEWEKEEQDYRDDVDEFHNRD